MKTLSRPAVVDRDTATRLDREYTAARWLHNRILDFEAEHQRVIDAAADTAAPGISRCARIVAKLRGRVRRRERSTGWSPPLHEEWRKILEARIAELRKARNADPAYQAALRWDRESAPGAVVKLPRRKAGETDEAFAARNAAGKTRSRREAWRTEVCYPQRRCFISSYNALCRIVDQARSAVLAERKAGRPAEWRRPRQSDPTATLHWEPGSWEIVDMGPVWWTIRLAVGYSDRQTKADHVTVRAKCGTWHDTTGREFATAKLTRIRDGRGYRYSLSLCVDVAAAPLPGDGVVGLDWGHREHGHPEQDEGIRAWSWHGDDGRSGVVILPAEIREQLDRVHELQSRIDTVWDARRRELQLPERSRQGYRTRLLREGAPTAEEAAWLDWETRYERRAQRSRQRVQALRRETYLRAVRELRQRYRVFAVEDQPGRAHRDLDTEEQTRRRKRENRDVVARYEFLSICERLGADVIPVPARDTTRECPDCGHLAERTSDLTIACVSCGRVRDRDAGAARVILRRGIEALANRAAKARNSEAAE